MFGLAGAVLIAFALGVLLVVAVDEWQDCRKRRKKRPANVVRKIDW